MTRDLYLWLLVGGSVTATAIYLLTRTQPAVGELVLETDPTDPNLDTEVSIRDHIHITVDGNEVVLGHALGVGYQILMLPPGEHTVCIVVLDFIDHVTPIFERCWTFTVGEMQRHRLRLRSDGTLNESYEPASWPYDPTQVPEVPWTNVPW